MVSVSQLSSRRLVPPCPTQKTLPSLPSIHIAQLLLIGPRRWRPARSSARRERGKLGTQLHERGLSWHARGSGLTKPRWRMSVISAVGRIHPSRLTGHTSLPLPHHREQHSPSNPLREVQWVPDGVKPHQGAGPPHRASCQQLRAGGERSLPGESRNQDPGKEQMGPGTALRSRWGPGTALHLYTCFSAAWILSVPPGPCGRKAS